MDNTTAAINGTVKAGDYVIVEPESDYGCLVGQIRAIDTPDSPKHSGKTETDEVRVNLHALICPPWAADSISESLSISFGYASQADYDDLPLENVRFTPDALISLNGMDDERIDELVEDYEAAESFCAEILEQYPNRERQAQPQWEDTTPNPLHRPLAVGDWAIVGEGGDYAGLVGKVTEIIRLDSPEHETGNPTDDIVVDLSLMNYSNEEKAEITAQMKDLGYDVDSYDDVAIDRVILAPENLIRVTETEISQYEPSLTAGLESAGAIGEMLAARHSDDLTAVLIDRVEQNYADYKVSLENFGAGELIDMAPEIHAWSDAYSYLTAYYDFSIEELSVYLQFSNPLSAVAETWKERRADLEEISYTMDALYEARDSLTKEYGLAGDKPPQARTEQEFEPTKTPETPEEQLYEKMSGEYGDFLNDLKNKPPSVIIESSYAKVFKEDLLLTIENGGFSDEQIDALLSLDAPLDELYSEWLEMDDTYMDTLRDVVTNVADEIIKERQAEQAGPERESEQAQAAPVSESLPQTSQDGERQNDQKPPLGGDEQRTTVDAKAEPQKSPFEKAIERNKAKAEAYKTQKAGEPPKNKNREGLE